MSTVVVNLDMN